MADRAACHSLASTFAEVTASGGMTKDLPALIMVPIWPALIPARITTIATSAAMAMIQFRRLLTPRVRCCEVAAISTADLRNQILPSESGPVVMRGLRTVTLSRPLNSLRCPAERSGSAPTKYRGPQHVDAGGFPSVTRPSSARRSGHVYAHRARSGDRHDRQGKERVTSWRRRGQGRRRIDLTGPMPSMRGVDVEALRDRRWAVGIDLLAPRCLGGARAGRAPQKGADPTIV